MSAGSSPSGSTVERWVQAFQEEGYVRLGRVVSDEELGQLSTRIDQIMDGEVRYDGLLMQLDPSAHPEGSAERMGRVDRNLLRLGTWELMFNPQVPRAVVLDEAVELAKSFGTEESSSFVNGVLDRVANDLGRKDEKTP